MLTYNKKTYTKQAIQIIERGFSLIELMIAVAIIAIIIALAVPAYRDYVARAQITEAWNMIEVVRVRMWEYFSQHGTFPENAPTGMTTDPAGNTLYELPPPAELGGRYVESVTVNSTGYLAVMPGAGHFPLNKPADGVLVKMRPNAAAPIAGKVIGLQMFITGNGTIHWVCSKVEYMGWGSMKEKPVNYGEVDLRLLPGSCRTR